MNAKEQEQNERKNWHLDKSISVTHVLSTISAIVLGAIFLSAQDTRITVLEKLVITQQKDISEQKQINREDLRRIEDKLDRVIEHLGNERNGR